MRVVTEIMSNEPWVFFFFLKEKSMSSETKLFISDFIRSKNSKFSLKINLKINVYFLGATRNL